MTKSAKKWIVREAWTKRTDVYEEAWHDLKSRVKVIAETVALTPVQKKLMPKLLLKEMEEAFRRASQLRNWEKELQKKGEI